MYYFFLFIIISGRVEFNSMFVLCTDTNYVCDYVSVFLLGTSYYVVSNVNSMMR